MNYDQEEYGRHGSWIPALVLIGLGAVFFLNNLHIIYLRDVLRYWPVALIVFGLFRLVDSRDAGGRTTGSLLAAAGIVFLSANLGLWGLRWRDLWPLALIGLGLLLLVNRLTGPKVRLSGERGRRAASVLNESAVFGGGKRQVVSPDFQGGKLDAVFGGFEVDLRQADIAGDSAELEINAVCGGAEVKVPLSWDVVVKGSGVFGAFVDSTEHPNPAQYPHPKQLFVRGSAVFGGVEIKN
jgi:hypothetical protein